MGEVRNRGGGRPRHGLWRLLAGLAVWLCGAVAAAAQQGAPTRQGAPDQPPDGFGRPDLPVQLVDLELVLAVDASSSVSGEEFELQMQGLAEAFADPRVMQAIQASGDLGLAVALIQWSDSRKQSVAVDWTVVRDAGGARAFSEELAATPRFLVGGGTAIGGALHFALRQLEINAYKGRRQVIDVSGDGRTNQGAHPGDIRDRAVAQGVTINGLAILNEDPTVDSYYFANVIGGTGAFVMTANDYESYALAILTKLIKEISGAPIVARPQPPAVAMRRPQAAPAVPGPRPRRPGGA